MSLKRRSEEEKDQNSGKRTRVDPSQAEKRVGLRGKCINQRPREQKEHTGLMSILCWNCQGLGSNLIIHHLKDSNRRYQPNVICLLKTNNKDTFFSIGLESKWEWKVHTMYT